MGGAKGTEYAANYRIENDVLTMIHTDAGYYTPVTPPAGVTGPVYAHLWYLQDHLGNIRVLADGGGNAVAMHDFDPFGEEIELGSTRLPYPFPPGGTESPYKYGGKEWNTTTSTYDFEARQLSPSFHRFTTMDPLCEKYYGISPYAYCANNPIRFVDPFGTWHWDSDGNLVWDKEDNVKTLSLFLNVSYEDAFQIVYRNTIVSDVLKEGFIIAKDNIWIEKKEIVTTTVHNTKEAWEHYKNGNGEPADVGDYARDAVIKSRVFQTKLNKITTQKVSSKGNFSVDLTGNPVTFHIGKTNINYSVEKSKNRDMVTFEIFVDDGFWDPNFLRQSDHSKKEQRHPDGPGPNLEMGGIPYRYGVRTRSYFFKPVTP